MATGACVLLSVCVGVCAAFNLDTTFPLLKTGEDGSLFGLSVALHLKKDTYLLLVGAPTEKAEPNVPANRTGGVYSCPITADQSDCRRVKLIDPDLLDPSQDLVEGMWLGVSVASQGQPGGRVLACGHRFVKFHGVGNMRHMIGRCYIRGNDLKYNESDLHWQPAQACNHLFDEHAEGMCTMGISASITQTEVIVGSPGSFDWQGNVHVSWMNPKVQFDTLRSSFPPPINKEETRRNIYIGYSVTQAHGLLSKDEETIVTGAPKDNRNDALGSVMLLVKQSKILVINQTLRGEQTGSYFGNALATVDLDNDGWNDLLVGAPFYFQRQEEVGGAVYVYMNKGGRFDLKHSLRLTGKAGSAFGMAVAAAGDLNQDGFQDFAVGAPFHETGSVMIWTGSSTGISEEPSQVIQGSMVSPGFRTFGYSLSGGLDVDRNKYPDLLVGSLDNMVTLLRSRPVIHLNKTLRVSPDMVDLMNCSFCIQVEVCFSYIFSTGQKSNRDNISIQFNVTADAKRDRLHFQNMQREFIGFLSMPTQKCKTLKVGLKGPIRDQVSPLVFSLNATPYEELPKDRNSVQDLSRFPVLSQTPQPITEQIHIQKACGSDNLCESNLQMTARFTDEKYKPFNIQDGIQVLHYNSSINKLLLEVNISNTGRTAEGQPAEDAHNTNLNISIPPSLTFTGVRPQNDIDCRLVDNYLQCELGNPFKRNQEVQRFIVFQMQKITSEIKSELRLTTLSKQDDLSPVNVSMLVEYSLPMSLNLINKPQAAFSGHVIGESAMKKTADIGSLVLFTFKVHLNGKPLVDLSNLAVEFDWPREVSNGKWLLYITEIQVNGTSEPRCTPPGNIVNPLNLVLSKEEKKVRKRSLEEEVTEEQEEQREEKTLPVLHLQGKKRKSYRLDCLHEAKCVKFMCPLVNMNNSATLTVRARLWNSTMIEDYSDARSVLVRGRATLKLHTIKNMVNLTISKTSISTEIEVDIYPDLWQQVDSGAPVWIIVVSVLAGVLLLALICLLLWKCGFFKRASTREIYEAKAQSAHMKSQPSEDDRLTQDL